MGIYLNDWSGCGLADVVAEFERVYTPFSDVDLSIINHHINNKYFGVNILFASYTYENYSGTAFVLFEKGGKLYEVNGGHCSCYGLEGQWEPEETSWESIKIREFDSLYDGFSLKDVEKALEGTKFIARFKLVENECSTTVRKYGIIDLQEVDEFGYKLVVESDEGKVMVELLDILNEHFSGDIYD